MTKNWEYAVYTKAASKAGGPSKYIQQVANLNKALGRRQMVPVLMIVSLTALVGSACGVYATLKNRKLERQIDLISDKFEECINDYNSSQDSSEDNNTLDS